MNPYLKQRGYPVINVVRNYNTGTVKISQECLVCAKLYNNTDSEEPKWWIPINFVTNSSLDFASTAPTYWLNPEEKDLIIDGIDSNDWIIVNVKNTGSYPLMEEENWRSSSFQIHRSTKSSFFPHIFFPHFKFEESISLLRRMKFPFRIEFENYFWSNRKKGMSF